MRNEKNCHLRAVDLENKEIFLMGRRWIFLIEILGILSFLGGDNRAKGSMCAIRKMFPSMRMRVDQLRPRRTCRHASPLVKVVLHQPDILHRSVQADALVNFVVECAS